MAAWPVEASSVGSQPECVTSLEPMQGIMRGISTRSNLHMGNWAASLAEKLKLYWRVGRLPGIPPFKPQRRWEAVDYATLPLQNRQGILNLRQLVPC